MSSTHCFLRTENRSICHGDVSSEFLISVRTGNFMLYALGHYSNKKFKKNY